jgi:hypothetical protein
MIKSFVRQPITCGWKYRDENGVLSNETADVDFHTKRMFSTMSRTQGSNVVVCGENVDIFVLIT